MRIDPYSQVNSVYRNNQKTKTQAAAKVSPKDALYISDTGKDYQSARMAVQSASDIREDKVADIRSRIQNGSYDVDEDAFAEKILSKLV